MLVKEIPTGGILWKGDVVLGIKGMTLPAFFDECEARALGGNPFDYGLLPQSHTEEQLSFIRQATKEWLADEDDEDQEPVEAFEKTEAPSTLNGDASFDFLSDDDLPF